MEEKLRRKESNNKIAQLQNELIPLVAEMCSNKEICFTAVQAIGTPSGNYWQPKKGIEGGYLYDDLGNDPEGAIEISKKVSDDYQKVIAEYFRRNPDKFGKLFEDGRNWTFGKLLMWSGPIVEEGLIKHQEIIKFNQALEDTISKKGENFFAFAHGNVIGDHIYAGKDKTLYLLGMRIVPRPGKGYYDFLRALDWILLKTDNASIDFNRIVSWMKQYLEKYEWEEVKLVFALRCVGILGWDMLHRGDFGTGDIEAKKQLALKFIKREY